MTLVRVTSKSRRWWQYRRRLFSLQMPDNWDMVQPARRRERWMRWLVALPIEGARRAMVRDLTPRWVRRSLSDLDMAGLTLLLGWVNDIPQCESIPVLSMTVKGGSYHFPRAKGENMRGIEYAIASDYYDEFLQGKAEALLHLAATLWREAEPNAQTALERDDLRVPLHNRTEVEQRAGRLKKMPPWAMLQALLYFGGLKEFVHRIYGTWLFEEPDDDDEDGTPAQPAGPNFGWWGVFQDVALTGAYGSVPMVQQTMLHELCVFLVKRQADARAVSNQSSPARRTDDDENDD